MTGRLPPRLTYVKNSAVSVKNSLYGVTTKRLAPYICTEN